MGSDDRFEQYLREVSLRQPSAAVQRKLLRRAKLQMRSTRRWRQMKVALVAAAVLLLVINVVAEGILARNIAAVTGQADIRAPLLTKPISINSLRARRQLIIETLELNGNGAVRDKEDDNVHQDGSVEPSERAKPGSAPQGRRSIPGASARV